MLGLIIINSQKTNFYQASSNETYGLLLQGRCIWSFKLCDYQFEHSKILFSQLNHSNHSTTLERIEQYNIQLGFKFLTSLEFVF